jgi:hypothetical protein
MSLASRAARGEGGGGALFLPPTAEDWRVRRGPPQSSLHQRRVGTQWRHGEPPDPTSPRPDLVVSRRRRVEVGGGGGRR